MRSTPTINMLQPPAGPLDETLNIKALAAAVLTTAMEDAQLVDRDRCTTVAERVYNRKVRYHRDQARVFLLTKAGPHAKSRQLWCELADIDQSAFDKRCSELLA